MHIGIITASMPPFLCGIGDYSLQLAGALRQLGHEASIVAGRGKAGDGSLVAAAACQQIPGRD